MPGVTCLNPEGAFGVSSERLGSLRQRHAGKAIGNSTEFSADPGRRPDRRSAGGGVRQLYRRHPDSSYATSMANIQKGDGPDGRGRRGAGLNRYEASPGPVATRSGGRGVCVSLSEQGGRAMETHRLDRQRFSSSEVASLGHGGWCADHVCFCQPRRARSSRSRHHHRRNSNANHATDLSRGW